MNNYFYVFVNTLKNFVKFWVSVFVKLKPVFYF